MALAISDQASSATVGCALLEGTKTWLEMLYLVHPVPLRLVKVAQPSSKDRRPLKIVFVGTDTTRAPRELALHVQREPIVLAEA